MQIEIYETQTTIEEVEADDQERAALVTELGLTESQVERTIPFPELSQGQYRVYEQLFHAHALWGEYRGYLPTRVLRTIKMYKDEFHRVEVWSDLENDPVLVGRTKQHGEAGCFLLARWGEALAPFAELRARALELWKAAHRANLTGALATLDEDALKHFNGEWVRTY
jgi:hypothetical protein